MGVVVIRCTCGLYQAWLLPQQTMEGDPSDILVSEGQEALLRGDFEKAAWALDTSLILTPSKGPLLWQRGLSCFYTGRYREGMEQLERENGTDVEGIVWHFLCKSKLRGYEEARKTGFVSFHRGDIPPPPPMLEVLLLFQSQTSPESVIEAATGKDGEIVRGYNDTDALAYAHFYIGLHYEAQGMMGHAAPHLLQAAELQNSDYMGRLMVMHHRLFLKTAAKRASFPSMWVGARNSNSPSYSASSVILGGWQLSYGHNLTVKQRTNADLLYHLLAAVDRGITAFDCGDIYTGVEELFGSLIDAHHRHEGRREDIHVHTKLFPDLDVIRAGKVDQEYVRGVVQRSLNRLGTSYVDLVQFHWWDHAHSGHMEGMLALCQLQHEGVVRQIGLTNFDTEHTMELLSAGVPIATTQVSSIIIQYHDCLYQHLGRIMNPIVTSNFI